MSSIPSDLKYARSHEWIRTEGDLAILGITDHAQHELTDIVFVELPEVGRELRAGDPCAVVESVKTASDIYSPVTGTVVDVNRDLDAQPGLVNSQPYTAGWFFKIRFRQPEELAELLDDTAYRSLIGA